MIPKKIHYCWFGGNSLSSEVRECIASWRQFCPDYEIIEWNEKNFDVDCIRYTADAYRDRRWAYVTDYARLKIVYEQGGIYLDTDVELLRPLDPLLENKVYFGMQRAGEVATGLGFGAEAGAELLRRLMAGYESRAYYGADGRVLAQTCVVTDGAVFSALGLWAEDTVQQLGEVTIYPVEYFNPKDFETDELTHLTERTYSIHHHHASWHALGDRMMRNKRRRLLKKYGAEEANERFCRWYRRRRHIIALQRCGFSGVMRHLRCRLRGRKGSG